MTTFSPRAWQPLPAPRLVDDLEENDLLASAEIWATPGTGPEDIVVDGNGAAFCGLDDGRVVRIDGTGGVETIADVGGRPLGIEWLDEGVMVVCNADLGLQRLTIRGEMTVLASSFEGTAFSFTNNAAVSGDGTVYFSDTSTRWTIHDYVNDLLEGQPAGSSP